MKIQISKNSCNQFYSVCISDKVLKWILVLNIHELNFIAPINGVFMDNLWKLKWDLIDLYIQSFSKTKFFIEIVDSSLYFYICKLESDNLETL